MILCIDAGNSRLKWGVCTPEAWLAGGAVAHDQLDTLAAAWHPWRAARQVMIANVAGPALADALDSLLLPWADRLHWVQASEAAGGVVNGYQRPRQLGVDRWCALIGARSLYAGPCLVVMAGTATTVDSLDGEGHFLGGLILPGLTMMRQALSRGTADLPLAQGQAIGFPRCTDDAIASGCLDAQLGAIERAWQRLPAGAEPACCLVSGGAAPALVQHLVIPCRAVDNLVLEGLRRLAP